MAEITEDQEGKYKGIIPRRIYLKDASYEAPNTPDIFLRKWKPTLELEIDNKYAVFDEGAYDVVLTVSVRCIIENKTAYMAEVHQCGIFIMSDFEEEQLERATQIHCLRILFPYASAELADLVNKGGFPQLLLRPVNFKVLYDQRQQDSQSQEDDLTQDA